MFKERKSSSTLSSFKRGFVIFLSSNASRLFIKSLRCDEAINENHNILSKVVLRTSCINWKKKKRVRKFIAISMIISSMILNHPKYTLKTPSRSSITLWACTNIVKGNRKNKHYISTKGFAITHTLPRVEYLKSRANPAWQTINNPSALLKNFLRFLSFYSLVANLFSAINHSTELSFL